MATMTSFIPANCNTVVYNPKIIGSVYKKSEGGDGISRIKNNTLRLLSFEMNFINSKVVMGKNGEPPIIIYIGFAPGDHLIKLMNFYEFATFFLFDEVEIPESILSYANSHDNVEVFDSLPDEDQMDEIASYDNVYLISNYTSKTTRSNQGLVEKDENKKFNLHMEKEKDNLKDTKINMEFARKINASVSLLKFRPPHIHSETKWKDYGLNILTSGEIEFFNGIIILPLFSGDKSSECRMIVTDYKSVTHHNFINLTKGINKWNITTKELPALNPLNDTKTPLPFQLGNQFEICVFFAILRDYFKTIGISDSSAEDIYSMYTNIISTNNDVLNHCK